MELAYAAGLFDGEGYVRIARYAKPNSTHVRWQVIAGLGMTYKPIIVSLHKQFNGSLYVNDHSKRNPNHRPQFMWETKSQDACIFLRQVLPFLVVKLDEAILCLDLQANIETYKFKLGNRFWKHTDHASIVAYRQSLADRVSELKHRRWQ